MSYLLRVLDRQCGDPSKEKTVGQQMLDSVEGISEAGAVAHVLALDAFDAVKDVAKTRDDNSTNNS